MLTSNFEFLGKQVNFEGKRSNGNKIYSYNRCYCEGVEKGPFIRPNLIRGIEHWRSTALEVAKPGFFVVGYRCGTC